jgi:hypothetical protein
VEYDRISQIQAELNPYYLEAPNRSSLFYFSLLSPAKMQISHLPPGGSSIWEKYGMPLIIHVPIYMLLSLGNPQLP